MKHKTQMIIEDLEKNPWRYVKGISGKGEFDFRNNDPDAKFMLDNGTELDAAQFGNYLAGYGAFYHFGSSGTNAVRVAGHIYAFIDKTFYPIFADEDWWVSVKNPPEGTLFDGPESKEWIGKGISDAIASERGDFWRSIIIMQIYGPVPEYDFPIIFPVLSAPETP